jgi:hypothetical protein
MSQHLALNLGTRYPKVEPLALPHYGAGVFALFQKHDEHRFFQGCGE